jgi:hypothetical protein
MVPQTMLPLESVVNACPPEQDEIGVIASPVVKRPFVAVS